MKNSLKSLVEPEDKIYQILTPNSQLEWDHIDILPDRIPIYAKIDVSGFKSPATLIMQVSS